jgi:hypothetical protein
MINYLCRIDDIEQKNDPTSAASSSEEDNADLDQLIDVNGVNYQRKIYTNNLLSAPDTCEIIIEFF